MSTMHDVLDAQWHYDNFKDGESFLNSLSRFLLLVKLLACSASALIRTGLNQLCQLQDEVIIYSRVAQVLNGLSVDAVYPILLLYPPETPVPSLSFHNLLLGSLLCPLACRFLLDSACKGIHSVMFDVIVAGNKWRKT